jgi:hypothetical protein
MRILKMIKKKSQKYRLLSRYPLDYIQKTWWKLGMYKGGDALECNPFVLFHLARDLKWSRPIPEHLLKAVQNGCWKVSERHYIQNTETIK